MILDFRNMWKRPWQQKCSYLLIRAWSHSCAEFDNVRKRDWLILTRCWWFGPSPGWISSWSGDSSWLIFLWFHDLLMRLVLLILIIVSYIVSVPIGQWFLSSRFFPIVSHFFLSFASHVKFVTIVKEIPPEIPLHLHWYHFLLDLFINFWVILVLVT